MSVTTAYPGARAQYERDGYYIFRDVIDVGLVEETRRHVEWLLERHPDLRPEQLHSWLASNDPFWHRLVSDDRMLDVAEVFLGPDIALFGTHYICKRPRDGQAVLWHQDGSYWPLEPMEVTTLWLAVDDSTPENGCMRVIPGTHTMVLQELQQRTEVDNVLGSGMDDALVDESKAVDLVLNAGDISVHHPNIIHGSNANTSEKWRRCLTMRYIPSTTKIIKDDEKPWDGSFFMRGQDPGVNNYHPRPKYVEGEHMPFAGCDKWV